MPLESCPKCSRKLAPPLRSSGRQVCMQCGWTDKPRQSNQVKPASPAKDLTPDEIQKILRQAASDSLNNMKPKSKQEADSSAEKRRFPFFGR